jgi:hypothetical protein
MIPVSGSLILIGMAVLVGFKIYRKQQVWLMKEEARKAEDRRNLLKQIVELREGLNACNGRVIESYSRRYLHQLEDQYAQNEGVSHFHLIANLTTEES